MTKSRYVIAWLLLLICHNASALKPHSKPTQDVVNGTPTPSCGIYRPASYLLEQKQANVYNDDDKINMICVLKRSNIFDLIETTKLSAIGNDMTITFYSEKDGDYEKIEVLQVNIEAFDEILTNYQDWLLILNDPDMNQSEIQLIKCYAKDLSKGRNEKGLGDSVCDSITNTDGENIHFCTDYHNCTCNNKNTQHELNNKQLDPDLFNVNLGTCETCGYNRYSHYTSSNSNNNFNNNACVCKSILIDSDKNSVDNIRDQSPRPEYLQDRVNSDDKLYYDKNIGWIYEDQDQINDDENYKVQSGKYDINLNGQLDNSLYHSKIHNYETNQDVPHGAIYVLNNEENEVDPNGEYVNINIKSYPIHDELLNKIENLSVNSSDNLNNYQSQADINNKLITTCNDNADFQAVMDYNDGHDLTNKYQRENTNANSNSENQYLIYSPVSSDVNSDIKYTEYECENKENNLSSDLHNTNTYLVSGSGNADNDAQIQEDSTLPLYMHDDFDSKSLINTDTGCIYNGIIKEDNYNIPDENLNEKHKHITTEFNTKNLSFNDSIYGTKEIQLKGNNVNPIEFNNMINLNRYSSNNDKLLVYQGKEKNLEKYCICPSSGNGLQTEIDLNNIRIQESPCSEYVNPEVEHTSESTINLSDSPCAYNMDLHRPTFYPSNSAVDISDYQQPNNFAYQNLSDGTIYNNEHSNSLQNSDANISQFESNYKSIDKPDIYKIEENIQKSPSIKNNLIPYNKYLKYASETLPRATYSAMNNVRDQMMINYIKHLPNVINFQGSQPIISGNEKIQNNNPEILNYNSDTQNKLSASNNIGKPNSVSPVVSYNKIPKPNPFRSYYKPQITGNPMAIFESEIKPIISKGLPNKTANKNKSIPYFTTYKTQSQQDITKPQDIPDHVKFLPLSDPKSYNLANPSISKQAPKYTVINLNPLTSTSPSKANPVLDVNPSQGLPLSLVDITQPMTSTQYPQINAASYLPSTFSYNQYNPLKLKEAMQIKPLSFPNMNEDENKDYIIYHKMPQYSSKYMNPGELRILHNYNMPENVQAISGTSTEIGNMEAVKRVPNYNTGIKLGTAETLTQDANMMPIISNPDFSPNYRSKQINTSIKPGEKADITPMTSYPTIVPNYSDTQLYTPINIAQKGNFISMTTNPAAVSNNSHKFKTPKTSAQNIIPMPTNYSIPRKGFINPLLDKYMPQTPIIPVQKANTMPKSLNLAPIPNHSNIQFTAPESPKQKENFMPMSPNPVWVSNYNNNKFNKRVEKANIIPMAPNYTLVPNYSDIIDSPVQKENVSINPNPYYDLTLRTPFINPLLEKFQTPMTLVQKANNITPITPNRNDITITPNSYYDLTSKTPFINPLLEKVMLQSSTPITPIHKPNLMPMSLKHASVTDDGNLKFNTHLTSVQKANLIPMSSKPTLVPTYNDMILNTPITQGQKANIIPSTPNYTLDPNYSDIKLDIPIQEANSMPIAHFPYYDLTSKTIFINPLLKNDKIQASTLMTPVKKSNIITPMTANPNYNEIEMNTQISPVKGVNLRPLTPKSYLIPNYSNTKLDTQIIPVRDTSITPNPYYDLTAKTAFINPLLGKDMPQTSHAPMLSGQKPNKIPVATNSPAVFNYSGIKSNAPIMQSQKAFNLPITPNFASFPNYSDMKLNTPIKIVEKENIIPIAANYALEPNYNDIKLDAPSQQANTIPYYDLGSKTTFSSPLLDKYMPQILSPNLAFDNNNEKAFPHLYQQTLAPFGDRINPNYLTNIIGQMKPILFSPKTESQVKHSYTGNFTPLVNIDEDTKENPQKLNKFPAPSDYTIIDKFPSVYDMNGLKFGNVLHSPSTLNTNNFENKAIATSLEAPNSDQMRNTISPVTSDEYLTPNGATYRFNNLKLSNLSSSKLISPVVDRSYPQDAFKLPEKSVPLLPTSQQSSLFNISPYSVAPNFHYPVFSGFRHTPEAISDININAPLTSNELLTFDNAQPRFSNLNLSNPPISVLSPMASYAFNKNMPPNAYKLSEKSVPKLLMPQQFNTFNNSPNSISPNVHLSLSSVFHPNKNVDAPQYQQLLNYLYSLKSIDSPAANSPLYPNVINDYPYQPIEENLKPQEKVFIYPDISPNNNQIKEVKSPMIETRPNSYQDSSRLYQLNESGNNFPIPHEYSNFYIPIISSNKESNIPQTSQELEAKFVNLTPKSPMNSMISTNLYSDGKITLPNSFVTNDQLNYPNTPQLIDATVKTTDNLIIHPKHSSPHNDLPKIATALLKNDAIRNQLHSFTRKQKSVNGEPTPNYNILPEPLKDISPSINNNVNIKPTTENYFDFQPNNYVKLTDYSGNSPINRYFRSNTYEQPSFKIIPSNLVDSAMFNTSPDINTQYLPEYTKPNVNNESTYKKFDHYLTPSLLGTFASKYKNTNTADVINDSLVKIPPLKFEYNDQYKLSQDNPKLYEILQPPSSGRSDSISYFNPQFQNPTSLFNKITNIPYKTKNVYEKPRKFKNPKIFNYTNPQINREYTKLYNDPSKTFDASILYTKPYFAIEPPISPTLWQNYKLINGKYINSNVYNPFKNQYSGTFVNPGLSIDKGYTLPSVISTPVISPKSNTAPSSRNFEDNVPESSQTSNYFTINPWNVGKITSTKQETSCEPNLILNTPSQDSLDIVNHAVDYKATELLKKTLGSYLKRLNNNNILPSTSHDKNRQISIPLDDVIITNNDTNRVYRIETNNPNVYIQMWNTKLQKAEANLVLKFKDFNVDNFMPVVINPDGCDSNEIRELVRSYIAKNYGEPIIISDPYSVNKGYALLNNLTEKCYDNKCYIMWPEYNY